ncbi:MAG: histidine--tRNA ligase [Acholeplasmataceae bacterium]
MKSNRVKGTYDVLPNESGKWQKLESEIKDVMKLYGFHEMRTPIMEYSEVFHRENDLSDMVTKETYDFLDRSDRKLTLRPEGTAGVIRSYVENKLYVDMSQQKIYYIGPNFRYERPQKGRYRQFYQVGLEALGSMDPALDAEVITLSYDLIKRLGLKGVKVRLNSLGDHESRVIYQEALRAHFEPYKETLCQDCQIRIDKNPLRILDCKIDQKHEAVISAPTPIDYLNSFSKSYFEQVIRYLDAAGVKYELAPRLVRGLDYYSHTVFEIEANINGFGAQNVLGGGGRYQSLIQELGGPDLPGIGVAFGMERLLMAIDEENPGLYDSKALDVYVLTFGEDFKKESVKLLHDLRLASLSADMNYTNKSFKGQLKEALKYQAKFIIILGEDEYKQGFVAIKNTKTENQENVKIENIVSYLKAQNGVEL